MEENDYFFQIMLPTSCINDLFCVVCSGPIVTVKRLASLQVFVIFHL